MSTCSHDFRRLAFLVVALIAALAAIAIGIAAPASGVVAVETRVGAISCVGKVPVEPPQRETPVQRLGEGGPGPGFVVATGVAANTADELAEIGFRSDTSHIFRNATGHLARDTAENRALIKSALDPANLRDAITLKNGTTLQKYFRDLPDGTQAWAEVRNGQITNGGLNVFPR